ncbi:alginate lyase family protein [Burkholderia sp. FERM BP-3421]|uniref:alginate lyase family protein n=1 Tax=Burkholderia sp. FERM BP-3421 TaxID=1494466 RepID=UPI0023623E51|nr:alginate lyase family protein [Burkholderia sp. FERM BP-3421]WDD95899.1 alginate lyase family protein [Burkholderia sp. FERM BP-3421]
MVRMRFPGNAWALPRRAGARALARALCACVAFAAAGPARAAMNFCAAPALQSNETTSAEPGVQALIRGVDARLGDLPKALPRVHTEGTLPGEGIHDQSEEALKDLELMRNAALAWRVTNQSRYLALVDRFLSAWVKTYQPSFNPIDETRFESLILAYDMTASVLPVKTRNATAAFIAKLGNGYVQQVDAQKRPLAGTWRNNWQSHRIKLIALSAFTLGDRRMMNAAQRLFAEHLADNLKPDGTTFDFEERDALHYAVYDLQPLVTAALAARRFNRNWLRERAAGGASLATALNWLEPYARGEKTHEEFVNSPVPFDAKRREAGLPGYSGQWDPKNATELFYLAARLDGRYLSVAQQLSPTTPAWLAMCLPLPAR